jgi:hypothetical protein
MESFWISSIDNNDVCSSLLQEMLLSHISSIKKNNFANITEENIAEL